MEHRNPRGRPSIREYSIRTPDSFSLYHHIGSDNISIDFRLVSEFNSPETVIVTETRDRTSISIRFQCDRHLRIDHSASLELQGFRTSATSRLIVSDRHWVEPIAWSPDSQIREITVSIAALSGRHSPSDSGPEFRSNNRSGRRTNNRRNQSRRSPQPNQVHRRVQLDVPEPRQRVRVRPIRVFEQTSTPGAGPSNWLRTGETNGRHSEDNALEARQGSPDLHRRSGTPESLSGGCGGVDGGMCEDGGED